jgi:hypothetical protein
VASRNLRDTQQLSRFRKSFCYIMVSGERDRRFSMDPQRSQGFSSPSSSPATEEPPPYIRRNTLVQRVTPRQPTEHTYFLKENNRDWVTLKLHSGAKSSKSLPTYFENEPITGSLGISAQKGDSIHSITAKVHLSCHSN